MMRPATHFDPHAEANPGGGFHPERLERISALLRADCDGGAIPGAVLLIARDGRLAFREAFGFADREARRPMRRDSIFRIASMTKPVTAVAALTLMEQGSLQLADPVARYLPEFENAQVGVETTALDGRRQLTAEPCRRPMTVHDLLRHTAGFTYGQFGDSLVQRAYRAAGLVDDRQTNQEFVGKLARLPLAFQPGTTFEYGMSTDVLGRIVEVASGMGLDRFFEERITRPLGMTDTGFRIAPDQRHRLAEPRQHAGGRDSPPVVPFDPARTVHWFSAGGGLLSTAADYARFAQLLLDEGELDGVRLLARKTVNLMLQNHLPAGLQYGPHTEELGISAPLPQLGQGYGLGTGVRMHAGLSPVPGSVGDWYWGGALGPYFWVDPAERLVVVFMLQELDVKVRTRYRSVMRSLVYQALL